MVTEDLNARPDDKDQQEQVEEMLHSDPDRQCSGLWPGTGVDDARMPSDEVLHRCGVA